MSADNYTASLLPDLPENGPKSRRRKKDRWTKVQKRTRQAPVEPLLPPGPYDEGFWARYLGRAFKDAIPVASLTEASAKVIFSDTLDQIGAICTVDRGDGHDVAGRAFEILHDALFKRATIVPPSKGDVLRELEELTERAGLIRRIISPFGSGLDTPEFEARHVLMSSMYRTYHGIAPTILQMRTLAEELEHLEQHCRHAMDALASFRPKRGLAWYEDFTLLMLYIAVHLGLKVTTAGDRASDPYRTPFTTLVFGLEHLLRDDVRSKRLSTCAKRIERTKAFKQFHDS